MVNFNSQWCGAGKECSFSNGWVDCCLPILCNALEIYQAHEDSASARIQHYQQMWRDSVMNVAGSRCMRHYTVAKYIDYICPETGWTPKHPGKSGRRDRQYKYTSFLRIPKVFYYISYEITVFAWSKHLWTRHVYFVVAQAMMCKNDKYIYLYRLSLSPDLPGCLRVHPVSGQM